MPKSTLKLEQTLKVIDLGWVFSPQARRERRIAREFQKLVQAHDDAIDRARSKHQPTQALRQAKTDFIHAALRSAL